MLAVFWLALYTLTFWVSMVFVLLGLNVELFGGVQKAAN